MERTISTRAAFAAIQWSLAAASIAAAIMPSIASPLAQAAGQTTDPRVESHASPPMVHPIPPIKPLAKPPIAPPGIVAVVNGQQITLSSAQDLAFQMSGVNAVGQLVDFALIDQEAKRLHISASDSELESRIDEIRTHIKPLTLEEAVRERNMTIDMLRDSLRHSIKREKMMRPSIQPTRMWHVRHILVQVTPTDVIAGPILMKNQHTDAEALALIKKAQTELASGKPFADVAREFSEDQANNTQGGDLGVITRHSPLPPSFLETVMKLKKGDITTEPVKSDSGYHIIQCVSTSDEHPADEAKLYADGEQDYVRQQLNWKTPEFMQQLRSKSKVINYVALGSKITSRQPSRRVVAHALRQP